MDASFLLLKFMSLALRAVVPGAVFLRDREAGGTRPSRRGGGEA